MEDTESSDFLSSCDSLYSASSATTTDRENPSYVDFDVFFSDGLDEASKAEEDFENVRMIPNSRLSSADHPVLIRLENEYQARRTFWHQRPGQYCRYPQEVEDRTSCLNQSNHTSGDSGLSNTKQEKPLKHFVFSEEANLETPQGLKRQRKPETELTANWWRQDEEQKLGTSEGDRIFAQKCRELQGFIKPLTELLNGLKRGRYDRGLSSFQQSVAMDRIQRIVGVLQKPDMGERYLGTLLQVEMMLKIWFPGVTSSSSSPSASDDDMEEPQCKMAKHSDVTSTEQKSCQLRQAPFPSGQTASKPSECPPAAPLQSDCSCCKERLQVLTEWPSMNLSWMHNAPICNPPISQVDLHHLNRALGHDLFGPNASSCGIIFLVQNEQGSSHRALPVALAEKPVFLCHRESTQDALSPRSHSAPAVVHFDQPRLEETKFHSLSLPHLPKCTQRPVRENT